MITNLMKKLLGDSYTEQSGRLAAINFGIVLAMFIISAIMLPFMPEQMPMQWKLDGSVNYTLPSVIGVWMVPLIGLILVFSMCVKKTVDIRYTLITVLLCVIMVSIYIFVAATQ